MPERREFILECQYVGGKVWTPDGLYALEGQNEEVVRCMDCKDYGDCMGTPWCWEFDHGTQPDGFCKWGVCK